MTDPELVEVTQADREAAVSSGVLSPGTGWRYGYSSSAEHLIRTGDWDHHPCVQAFARHRIAAIAAARPAILEEAAMFADDIEHFARRGSLSAHAAHPDMLAMKADAAAAIATAIRQLALPAPPVGEG